MWLFRCFKKAHVRKEDPEPGSRFPLSSKLVAAAATLCSKVQASTEKSSSHLANEIKVEILRYLSARQKS